MPAGQRFGRPDRLRNRLEFRRVYDAGGRRLGRLMTLFVGASDQPRARLGIAATRKLGSAVRRNRAKRLIRELFRRHRPAAGLDIVVVPRPELLDAPFANLEAEFIALLRGPDARRWSNEGRRAGGPRRPAGDSRV